MRESKDSTLLIIIILFETHYEKINKKVRPSPLKTIQSLTHTRKNGRFNKLENSFKKKKKIIFVFSYFILVH
jgi:hypothetical protein